MTFNVLGAVQAAETTRNALMPRQPQMMAQPGPGQTMPAHSGGGGDFMEAIRAAESGGDYNVVNDLGYTGAYQFGQARLDDFNRANGANLTTRDLIGNQRLQDAVARWHFADIDQQLAPLAGAEVGGKPVTTNALRAIAHLGGVGGARRYVESGGQYNPQDAYGTSLQDYHKRFY